MTLTVFTGSKLVYDIDKSKSSIDIPNNVIKLAAKPLSAPFTKIYNQLILTAVAPNILKVSQVTPVYKSGDITNPGNYRPISILSWKTYGFQGY